jgi:hypothetical protein
MRREEGDNGHARMILREGGRGAGMRGGVVNCPTARRCPGQLREQLAAMIY